MRKLDLNCDLGEGEPLVRTRDLMRWITSANVACGGHAGDAKSMKNCAKLARQLGVKLGAHPGPWSRGDRGRSPVHPIPADFELLLLHQVGALERIATSEGVRLHHIKLHGALYHAVESDVRLARTYLRLVKQYWPNAAIYALAGGLVIHEASQFGLRVFAEGFADRAYRADGNLVPRTKPGAVLSSASEVVARVRDILAGHGLTGVDGRRIRLKFDTLCVHSDSPDSLKAVRAIAKLLR